ncbi:MAG: GNAT family protein [Pseudomonadota bacterium]
MTTPKERYFGTEEQKALLRRGRAMFNDLRGERRYTYYGRTVGIADAAPRALDRLEILTRLQGNSNCAFVPNCEVPEWKTELKDRGLKPFHYARWLGGAAAMRRAREIVSQTPLPSGLTVVRVGPETDPTVLEKLAALALDCAVLPPAGAVLRGVDRPGLALLAITDSGEPVSCAAAAGFLHPDHPKAHQCWWGMLATAPRHRGQRLALILGAMAMLEARDRLGFREVFTGVEPGNSASETVCEKLGLLPEDHSVIGVADPGLVPGGRMTK